MHEKVYVLDFDAPNHQFSAIRQSELDLLKKGKFMHPYPPEEGSVFYPITKIEEKNYTRKEMDNFLQAVEEMKESREGYLIMDFPGHFSPRDPMYHIMRAGLMDLIVYPVDSDRQSQTGALLVNGVVNGREFLAPTGRVRQESLVIWNREARSERVGKRDWYAEGNRVFETLGIPVAETRIRDLLIMRRDANARNFVRSTVMFPLTDVKRQCPEVLSAILEIKARIDGVQ